MNREFDEPPLVGVNIKLKAHIARALGVFALKKGYPKNVLASRVCREMSDRSRRTVDTTTPHFCIQCKEMRTGRFRGQLCNRCYKRQYNQLPESKQKARDIIKSMNSVLKLEQGEMHFIKNMKIVLKLRNDDASKQRPEYKQKAREYERLPEVRERRNANLRERRKSPEYREYRYHYKKRPDVKLKARLYYDTIKDSPGYKARQRLYEKLNKKEKLSERAAIANKMLFAKA